MSHSVPSLTRVSVREIAKSCKSTKKFSPEHAVGQDFFIFHAFFSKNPVFVFHSFPPKKAYHGMFKRFFFLYLPLKLALRLAQTMNEC